MIIDLTGKTFGKLTVIERAEKPKNSKCREAFWLCQCECGNSIISRGSNLRNGNTKSCGCLQKQKASENKTIDLTNQKFGKLTVLNQIEERTKDGRIQWKCKCDCGNYINVITYNLTHEKTISCGCIRRKDISNQIFGNYKVIKPLDIIDSSGTYYWKIQCLYCGEERQLPVNRITTENLICPCQREYNYSNYEKIIKDILEENNYNFIKEKTFKDLKNPKTNRFLRCDFYVNNQYIIEVDGSQHFREATGIFGSKYSLKDIQYLDHIKNNWCKIHNVPIIRIPYKEITREKLSIEDLVPSTSKFLLK